MKKIFVLRAPFEIPLGRRRYFVVEDFSEIGLPFCSVYFYVFVCNYSKSVMNSSILS